MSLLIARTPVFDHEDKLFAYGLAVHAPRGDADAHDEITIEQLFAQIFLEREADTIADGRGVFLTVGRAMVLSGVLPMLPADRVILQLSSSGALDADFETACRDLVSTGYRLAVTASEAIIGSPILDLAHVVAVDVTRTDAERLSSVVTDRKGPSTHLLASGVRHRTEREQCRKLGFNLFEGFRVSAPELLALRDIDAHPAVMLEALRLLCDPAVSDRAIEELIGGDVRLSHNLLRMMNAASGRERLVLSIRHGLRLLDREQVARCVGVLLATDGVSAGSRGELMHLALLKARMCERVADLVGLNETRSSLFLVGLISVLDQLLELPTAALCDAMRVSPELRSAALTRTGPAGTVLRLVEAYTAGDWRPVEDLCRAFDVKPETLRPVYLEAMSWASSQRRIPRKRTRPFA